MNESTLAKTGLPVLGLVGLALPSGAAIVSSSPAGFPWDSRVDGVFSIDFNGDTFTDFRAPGSGSTSDQTLIESTSNIHGFIGYTYGRIRTAGTKSSAELFVAGETIDAAGQLGYTGTTAYSDKGGPEYTSRGGADLLTNGERAYVGVIFGAPGAPNAAWVDLEGAGPGNIIVHGWGWETTPNTPILAGAMGLLADEPSGGGAGGPAAAAAAQANTNNQIGQYRAMQANQAHARRVAERQRLQAARR